MTRKVTFMCLLVLATFTLTVTPLSIDVILLGQEVKGARQALIPLYVLSLASTGANPVIYGFMWREFRLSVLQVTVVCRVGEKAA